MKSVSKFQTSKEKVEFLLKKHPDLVKDDKKLWISYLVLFYDLKNVLSHSQAFDSLCQLLFKEKINAATILRTKQKIQEDKKQILKIGKEHKNLFVKSRVEHLLKNYPALKENDMQLWLSYLVMFHDMKERLNSSSDPYEEFCSIILDQEVPAISSVRRTRQIIQKNGDGNGEHS